MNSPGLVLGSGAVDPFLLSLICESSRETEVCSVVGLQAGPSTFNGRSCMWILVNGKLYLFTRRSQNLGVKIGRGALISNLLLKSFQ